MTKLFTPAELQTGYGPSTSPTAPNTSYRSYQIQQSPSISGSNISTVTSKQRLTTAAIQSTTLAALSAQNSVQSRAAYAKAFGNNPNGGYTDTLTDAAWHALQPGVMPVTALDYRNKPTIRLFAIDGSDASVHVPPFTNFILTNVQALDQERFDGAPGDVRPPALLYHRAIRPQIRLQRHGAQLPGDHQWHRLLGDQQQAGNEDLSGEPARYAHQLL